MTNVHRMIKITSLSAIAILCGCSSGNATTENIELVSLGPVELETLAAGNSITTGSFENKRVEVFRDQESLNQSLQLFAVDESLGLSIEFDKKQVALVSMGPRSTGGYSIVVNGATEYDDHLKLELEYLFPKSDCPLTGGFTNPYLFIEINNTKELLIEEALSVREC